MLLQIAFENGNAVPVLGAPLLWIGVIIAMFFVRLYLEVFLIGFEWIIETTNAARLYLESNKKEQKK